MGTLRPSAFQAGLPLISSEALVPWTVRTKRFYVDLVSNAGQAILSFANGKITSWNEGAQRVFGYEEGEVLQKPAEAIIAEEERWRFATHLRTVAEGLADGDVMMLENLRYHAAEEKNDPDFARDLSAIGDIYVNDAFSCAHRAHASTEAIARLLPSYAGLALMKEVDALRTALEQPERPVAAVIGGAKVSTKIPVLTNVASKVDMMIIGGGMANTFLHAGGVNVGNSLCEPDSAETVTAIATVCDYS